MAERATITIDKDEYIDLLRYKADALENLSAALATPLPGNAKPHSWTGLAEQLEVIRLHELGHLPWEIAKKVGRPRSTVCRIIRKHKAKVFAA